MASPSLSSPASKPGAAKPGPPSSGGAASGPPSSGARTSGPASAQAARIAALREALASRVVVADGAMGTMLQSQNPTLDDFQQLEGCNEILNVTRPDIVRSVHEAYFAVGVDCVETNTFGANHSAASEYDIADRIHELSESGARLAREVADDFATDGRPRWVLGSIGPGT
jgi:5-methyltetrahydrofolate--homocysteine methyltransferase